LKGLFSLSFREPSIENINAQAGNDPIRPEHTRVFELEAAADLGTSHRLSANAFDIGIDAPIAYSHNPVTGADGYLNLGKQGTRGIEIAYRLRLPVARLDANYSYYVPTLSENIGPYIVAGHSDRFVGAPAHRGALVATVKPWPELGLALSPTLVLLGPRFARGPVNAGIETPVELPAQLLANLVLTKDDLGVRGLSASLGVYNIFGANDRFVHASAPTTYEDDHAPLPGLDREVLARLTYVTER
jgi:outer membrane receptor protein involved in Fe transport